MSMKEYILDYENRLDAMSHLPNLNQKKMLGSDMKIGPNNNLTSTSWVAG